MTTIDQSRHDASKTRSLIIVDIAIYKSGQSRVALQISRNAKSSKPDCQVAKPNTQDVVAVQSIISILSCLSVSAKLLVYFHSIRDSYTVYTVTYHDKPPSIQVFQAN